MQTSDLGCLSSEKKSGEHCFWNLPGFTRHMFWDEKKVFYFHLLRFKQNKTFQLFLTVFFLTWFCRLPLGTYLELTNPPPFWPAVPTQLALPAQLSGNSVLSNSDDSNPRRWAQGGKHCPFHFQTSLPGSPSMSEPKVVSESGSEREATKRRNLNAPFPF